MRSDLNQNPSRSAAGIVAVAVSLLEACAGPVPTASVDRSMSVPLLENERPLAHVYLTMQECVAMSMVPDIDGTTQACAGASEVLQLSAESKQFEVSWRMHHEAVDGPVFADSPHRIPQPDANDKAAGLRYRLLICFESPRKELQQMRHGLKISSVGLVARLYDTQTDELVATTVYRDVFFNVSAPEKFRTYGRHIAELAVADLFK